MRIWHMQTCVHLHPIKYIAKPQFAQQNAEIYQGYKKLVIL